MRRSVRCMSRDRQPRSVGQEVNAVDDNPLERRNFQAELACGVGLGRHLDRIALAVNRGGSVEDDMGVGDRLALTVDDLAGPWPVGLCHYH